MSNNPTPPAPDSEPHALARRATRGLAPTSEQYETIAMALDRARSISVYAGSRLSTAYAGGMIWAKDYDPESLKRAVAQNLIPTRVPYIPTDNDLVEVSAGLWMLDMEDLADRIHELLAAALGEQGQR